MTIAIVRMMSRRARVGELKAKNACNVGRRRELVATKPDRLVWNGPLALPR